MLRVRRIVETPLIRIDRIDHPPDAEHVDPDEEESQQYSVNLLERGTFSVRDRSHALRVTVADLFLTAPGKVHRYVHDETGAAPSDVCVAVCFTDAARDEVRGLLGPLEVGPAVVPPSNRRAYVRKQLLESLQRPDDSLAVELASADLLHAAADRRERHLYRPQQLAWYAKRVDDARRRLAAEFAVEHSLAQLARTAGMSPFHFARVFRELTGVPPHRYLIEQRLAAALQQLREGASVTETCFAVGFTSLSHFIHLFRQHFGMSPSRARGPRPVSGGS